MSDEFKNGTCAPSDCASCGLDCGNASPESHNTITLTLDDDTEIECAILTVFPVEKQEYKSSKHERTKLGKINIAKPANQCHDSKEQGCDAEYHPQNLQAECK